MTSLPTFRKQRGVMAEYNKYRASVSTTGDFNRFSKVRSPPIRGIKGPFWIQFLWSPPKKNGRAWIKPKMQVIQFLTFFYPQKDWRSLNLWRGHLTIPKRSQKNCQGHFSFQTSFPFFYQPGYLAGITGPTGPQIHFRKESATQKHVFFSSFSVLNSLKTLLL